MELTLQQSGAGETTALTVSDRVFGAEFNEPLVHQVLTAYRAGARSGTRAQRSRSIPAETRRPQKAAPSKGHGPRARGHNPQPDLAWRRGHVCGQTAVSRQKGKQKNVSRGHARHSF